MPNFPRLPFDPLTDGDKLKEECGIFGVIGVSDGVGWIVAVGLGGCVGDTPSP